MKNKWILIAIICLLIGATSYKLVDVFTYQAPDKEVTAIPVEVLMAKETVRSKNLVYQGRIKPVTVEKIAFKSPARLLAIQGKIGDPVALDQPLVIMDETDQALAYEAAKQQVIAARAQYDQALNGASQEDIDLAKSQVEKAGKALTYLEDQEKKMKSLLEEGVVSQNDYDGLKLEVDLAESDYSLAKEKYDQAVAGTRYEVIEAARAQWELAKLDEEAQLNLLNDLTYKPSQPGILIETLYEPGELVPAGYPVALVRSPNQEVVLGVTGKDLDRLKLGDKGLVSGLDKDSQGTISQLAELPDDVHFLYEVAVRLDQATYKIGQLVDVSFEVGQEVGIEVPIQAISNDQIDYVYIVKDNHARLKKVTIVDTFEGKALVTGLDPGDQVILTNLNRMTDQTLVKILEKEMDQ